MAEEGEDAAAMLSAPETLTEEEQEELRRELTKVSYCLWTLRFALWVCRAPGDSYGKGLKKACGACTAQSLRRAEETK